MRYRGARVPVSVYKCAVCDSAGHSGAMNGLHLIGRAGTKGAKARQVLVCSSACEVEAFARGLASRPVETELTGTADSIQDKQVKRTRRRSRV